MLPKKGHGLKENSEISEKCPFTGYAEIADKGNFVECKNI